MQIARPLLVSTALPLASVSLWLSFGDGSAWRAATVALGAGLIAWALPRLAQPPAPQQRRR
jgi:hypothetical protein